MIRYDQDFFDTLASAGERAVLGVLQTLASKGDSRWTPIAFCRMGRASRCPTTSEQKPKMWQAQVQKISKNVSSVNTHANP